MSLHLAYLQLDNIINIGVVTLARLGPGGLVM